MTTLELQITLSALGYHPGEMDGYWGPDTEKALKSFQRDNGLLADGIVGDQTRNALQIALYQGNRVVLPLTKITPSNVVEESVRGVENNLWLLVGVGIAVGLLVWGKKRKGRK